MEIEKQLDLVYTWFQNTFDNNCQCQLEKEVQKRGGKEAVHVWVWTKFFAVDAPKFGDHVLFAKQGFVATGQVYRQRVYTFLISREEGCIMNQIYKLKDETWIDKAEENPSSVVDLDPVNDAECLEGCGVYWEFLPEENRFHGTTKEGTCRFESKFFPGKTIIASSDVYLTSSELWTRDRGVDTDGNKMYGFENDEHHKCLHRVTYKGTVEHGGRSQEVSLHNQGGIVKIGDEYSVKLEQAVDSVSGDRMLRACACAEGREEAVGVVVADWDASVISGECGDFRIRLEKKQ